jgi:hypothetical protein
MKSFASVPYQLPASGIRNIMELATSMENVIHLEVGQPDFVTALILERLPVVPCKMAIQNM